MLELANLSVSEAKQKMFAGEFTSVELTEACLRNAELHNPELNAFIEITREVALQQAAKADIRIRNGNAGLLEGIPIAIKDIFCTKNMRTTAASKILSNFIPPYDATVVDMALGQGGVNIGKTNLDEFAMGSTNHFSYYKPTYSPWKNKLSPKSKLVPGGSSGGSAVAVAKKMALCSLGTDTGGSVRQPSSFCGIFGIKPTYGRCSRWGVIALASSFDHPSIFTRSATDAAIVLEAISGYDPKDSTSAPIKVPHFIDSIGKSIKNLKVGIPEEIENAEGIEDSILEIWEKGKKYLQENGAILVPVKFPRLKYCVPTYYVLMSAEASSNLARYDGVRYGLRDSSPEDNYMEMIAKTRAKGFGEETKRRIMLGTYVLSAKAYGAYYIHAQKIRKMIAQDFAEALKKVDVILMPTAPTLPFAISDKHNMDPTTLYMGDLLTIPVNLAGLPAASIPVERTSREDLPVGLQIIGKYYDEETVLKASAALEKAANFKGL
jgi:aspartyl-tRNA(Asn)/glutamyl-tRNA(Gln) amidotransferase subunit A